MIELEKTYISSSMEAQIAEMIGRDEKSNDYRFYHLFSSLVFDKTKKELRFPLLGVKALQTDRKRNHMKRFLMEMRA